MYTVPMSETFLSFLHTYVISYSGFAAIGILAVFVAALLLCIRLGVDWMRLLPCMMVSFIPLYAGAKLFGFLSLTLYRLQYGIALDKTVFTNAGIVFYGGLLAYLASAWFLVRRFLPDRKPLAWDIVGTTVPLFHGCARIGCYVGGCCYGVDCSSELCVRFFSGRLPVQLIESCFNFLLFDALAILLFRATKLRGRITFLYLLCYAVFRFGIEFFRADVIRGGVGPLSFSQIVSLGILVFLACAHGRRMIRIKRENNL